MKRELAGHQRPGCPFVLSVADLRTQRLGRYLRERYPRWCTAETLLRQLRTRRTEYRDRDFALGFLAGLFMAGALDVEWRTSRIRAARTKGSGYHAAGGRLDVRLRLRRVERES
jgi:hypothetical protein